MGMLRGVALLGRAERLLVAGGDAGQRLVKGEAIEDILKDMTVEGVATASVAVLLCPQRPRYHHAPAPLIAAASSQRGAEPPITTVFPTRARWRLLTCADWSCRCSAVWTT